MSTQTTLKPCPFCGESHATQMQKFGRDTWSVIACEECGAHGPDYTTDADAIDAWNRRAQTTDTLFDPEAEGWEPRKTGTGGGTYYDEPSPGCLTFVTIPSTGLVALLDLCDGITLYHGKHPTRSLVMAIIRQNGEAA